jgi:hypothetical protein
MEEWKYCVGLEYQYNSDAMAKDVSDKKQSVVESLDEDTMDLLPTREVTQEVLDLIDEGQAVGLPAK